MAMHFHDLGVGTAVIDGLEVETRLQEHTDPSLGIKIGGMVCCCTDTACSESTITFARGCRVLLHESWFDALDYAQLNGQALTSHSHVEWVANAALKAGVDVLMLIHFNPGYTMERLEEMEKQAKHIFPHSCLAREGQSIIF
jgi:ribonuclease Z